MADFTPQTSCATPEAANVLTVEQARSEINALATPVSGWRKCALRQALGEVLAEPVISTVNVPPQNNSAMDGYAIRSSDIQTNSFTLKRVGAAFAGTPFSGRVNAGECVRIMTGAVVPADCDTVVMQEDVETDDDLIKIHGQHQAGQNVRSAGEDIAAGAEVLPAGHRLTPADLGLIASLGCGEVIIKRKLRVAFFSTGDELRSIGETLEPGQIYDSNRYTLYGMLTRLNVEVIDMGVVVDDPDTLKQALLQAAAEADVVITSGGVSVGEADYIKDILAEIGSVNFWKIAMKPGRPVAYGRINNSVFFGLPGNPVSVMVTFYQFVQQALQKMAGEQTTAPLLYTAVCDNQIHKRPGRFEFQRGILFQDNAGQLKVQTTGAQGSGVLHSMSLANCFILLDSDCAGVDAGQPVIVQPFSGLV